MLLQVAVSDVTVTCNSPRGLIPYSGKVWYSISVGDDPGESFETDDCKSWNARTQIRMQNGSVKVKSLSIAKIL